MAVVTRYASGIQDPAVKPADLLPSTEVAGHMKTLVSTLEAVIGDSATSVYKFGKIPSNARINTNSLLEYDALTALVDFDLGEKTTKDCLIDGQDIHLAGSVDATKNVDIAKLNWPFWKIAGYAADPGGELEVIGTLNAAAPTAGGTITLTLIYQVDM